MPNIEQWIFLLGNFGFPILITVYLLIRFEKKIEDLSKVISTLDNSINKTNNK